MAETSGFMTDLPQSAYLSLSMKRAISSAQQRSHRYVTLEHLLLALLDDPAAVEILEGVRADVPSIRMAITETVNRNLVTLYTPGEFDLRASYKVERVLQTGSDDADRLGCDEVDAAFVLAALSRESDSVAAGIMKRNGFSYAAAVTWLYANRGSSPASRAARSPRQSALAPVPKAAPSQQTAKAGDVPAGDAESEPAMHSSQDQPANGVDMQKKRSSPLQEETEGETPRVRSKDPMQEEALELTQVVADENDEAGATHRASREDASHKPLAQTRGPEQAPPPPVPRREAVRGGLTDRTEKVFTPGSTERPTPATPLPKPQASEASNRLPQMERRQREGGAGLSPSERRIEPILPPPGRLEEMRLGSGPREIKPFSAPPAPDPAKKRARARKGSQAEPMPAPSPERQKTRARRPRPQEVMAGRLIETIPRRMRAESPERVEVRISREETQIIARGMEGRSDPIRHDILVTQTMSVALRAPDGGFTIEPLSPETQWIFDRPETGETYGRWRWVVTPQSPGQRRLQLIVASRSVGQNGLVGDTALPDQIITVRVRTNYLRSVGRGLKWILAMMVGGILTEVTILAMRMFGQ